MQIFLGLIIRAIFVLACVALATFALLWHAPGDPALTIAPPVMMPLWTP